MDKQFTLYISHLDATEEGSAKLDLPAGPYAIRDALEKARVKEDDLLLLEMESCRCEELETWFGMRQSGMDQLPDIYWLNALAGQMEKMDTWNVEAFGGAIRIEAAKELDLPLERLYDIAGSLHLYNFAAGVTNDAKLGRFFVENEFIPETEELPESVLKLLDYGKIGREMREAEGGVFIESFHGYLVQGSDIPELHAELDVKPREPDYAVLLDVGYPECGDEEQLKLPASEEALNEYLRKIGAQSWDYLAWRCADCKIPAMADAFSTCESVAEMNEAAKKLDALSGAELLTCKAMAEIIGFQDLQDAVALMDVAEDYVLTPSYTSPIDVGKDRIRTAMDKSEAELIMPYVSLYSYGEKVMETYNMKLTDYGVLERADGQPIPGQVEQNAPERGGMEMA